MNLESFEALTTCVGNTTVQNNSEHALLKKRDFDGRCLLGMGQYVSEE